MRRKLLLGIAGLACLAAAGIALSGGRGGIVALDGDFKLTDSDSKPLFGVSARSMDRIKPGI